MPRRSSRKSPRSPEDAQAFFRVALQRFDESQFLLNGERHAISIYLAGYSVECSLKALILSLFPRQKQREAAGSFRGGGWHQFNRLIDDYIDRGGPRHPPAIARALTYVTDEWSVDLRYEAGERPFREAYRFSTSTIAILDWVKGRL